MSGAAQGTGRQVEWRPVGIFCLLTFGLAWLVQGGLALAGGLTRPWAGTALMVMMFVPLVATVLVCRFVTHQPWAFAVGLHREGLRHRGWLRVVVLGLLSVLVLLIISALVIALASALGWLEVDRRMPGLDAVMNLIPADQRPQREVLLAAQLVNIPIAAFTINGLLALGEEVGWRGWLLGALWPLGRVRANLLIGVLWGLWHAPLIAMGYEYSHQIPFVAGVVLFTGWAVAAGICLAWLRMRSGSVLAAAVGHGAINAIPSLPLVFVAKPEEFRWAQASIIGVLGVLLLGLLAVALLLWGRWSARPAVRKPVGQGS